MVEPVDGVPVMVSGAFERRGELSDRLLRALAADLLRETDHTVDAIARKVGYANAFALSVAFKRRRGTRPSDHRRAESG